MTKWCLDSASSMLLAVSWSQSLAKASHASRTQEIAIERSKAHSDEGLLRLQVLRSSDSLKWLSVLLLQLFEVQLLESEMSHEMSQITWNQTASVLQSSHSVKRPSPNCWDVMSCPSNSFSFEPVASHSLLFATAWNIRSCCTAGRIQAPLRRFRTAWAQVKKTRLDSKELIADAIVTLVAAHHCIHQGLPFRHRNAAFAHAPAKTSFFELKTVLKLFKVL